MLTLLHAEATDVGQKPICLPVVECAMSLSAVFDENALLRAWPIISSLSQLMHCMWTTMIALTPGVIAAANAVGEML